MKKAAKKKQGSKADIMQELLQRLRDKGASVTKVRRDVLQAIVNLKKPAGAYNLLETINKNREKPLSPISLYRALDLFISLGIVVKIDRTNAYALCCGSGDCHHHVMIICDKCGELSEFHNDKAISELEKLAKAKGIEIGLHGIEIHGFCKKCR